ncbi:ATP synthase F1 subunit epsilon [Ureaplasma miroungigenitalium]|uniref:ATP synthase epsilon chain n=1 Tax=Ureaplasma miroungigenitalium TaxID=1042321 RepID=A0ABT3BN22_9BACT|nr:ATP synthase F1 subunit epsilon [Ureaplasma miroungigenitalium]MCV3728625.1 ATP synthase F1 subunit epsilon [Ureaplasma miroungigenitalium]MCV3734317.1 ATP synthase F1 subunit epsilon [Ureaplasma miroungigenitalium]
MISTQLKIVSPYAQTLTQAVYSVELKTTTGRIAVLPNHNPLMAPIENHIAYVRPTPSAARIPYVILEGVIYVEEHQIRVFTDYFKPLSEVNAEEIEQQLLKDEKAYTVCEDDKKKMQIKSNIKLHQAILLALKDK